MDENDDIGSPSWGASLFMQTTEDVARAVASAAAAAVAARSPRPSVVYSSKDESGSQLQKLQHQVSRLLKGLSSPPDVKSGTYNPEILTSQKRQWARFQLQSLDHKVWKEPSRLFESMVVVGLHPNCDIQALHNLYFGRRPEGSGRFRNALNGQSNLRIEPNLEPQVLFVYPPDKQLPLKYKDLLSFCFPAGVEVHAVERTPSMSELNEILLGQRDIFGDHFLTVPRFCLKLSDEHVKQSDLSFVFRLQVADDSSLYGCCVLIEELVQKPSGLISMISDGQPACSGLSRQILTTRRCYCILSRLPFFQLHFGVLNSIFTEERLERLTKNFGDLDWDPPMVGEKEDTFKEESGSSSLEERHSMLNGVVETSHSSLTDSLPGRVADDGDDGSQVEHQTLANDILPSKCENKDNIEAPSEPDAKKYPAKVDSAVESQTSEACERSGHELPNGEIGALDKQQAEMRLPNAVLPLLRYQQYESSESSSSFQGSPSEGRRLRTDADDAGNEEPTFSGQDTSDHNDILDWAMANNYGSLQIICQYYRLRCPARGSSIMFHPLDHLHPLEYQRPHETMLQIPGSTIDLESCNSRLELAEAYCALMAEEEATSLSVWAIACLCGSLRLEHVLTLFAGALLEKQIVILCSNLGVLSASVLSVIPLIRPYHWQSLLMPVLPSDMLDFLDAPVPYIVGVKNKTADVQSKLTNVILIDVNKNQVKSPTIPALPQQRDLYSRLSPYHAKLVGESFLGRKRPVYDCTEVQVEAAKGFLAVLREYLDSLCSNLRSHTITNVQSNDDKVSLLLKESFIESFPSRDRPFMKHFVDTQLFSVHTDFVLSFFQKE